MVVDPTVEKIARIGAMIEKRWPKMINHGRNTPHTPSISGKRLADIVSFFVRVMPDAADRTVFNRFVEFNSSLRELPMDDSRYKRPATKDYKKTLEKKDQQSKKADFFVGMLANPQGEITSFVNLP